MKRVVALLASLTLTGCVSSREVSFQKRASIPAGSAIGVITPPDGVYMEDEYPKSGTVVARKLVAALVPHFPASGVVTPEMNIEYVLKPQILHWEDRATEWSAKPDRVKVSLPLYKSGQLVGSALISAKSSYWTLGGDLQRICWMLPLRLTQHPWRERPRPTDRAHSDESLGV